MRRALVSLIVDQLFERFEIHPVLVEVGALGQSPLVWNEIAHHAIYVGLGPDAKRRNSECRTQFYRKELLEDVIVPSKDNASAISFIVAEDPAYSGVLPANDSVRDHFIAGECSVRETMMLQATTLNSVVERLSLPTVDWIHINTNCNNVEIFSSLRAEARNCVLAVDLVMYLLDLCMGDRGLGAGHAELVNLGFWPSRMYPYGFVRMKQESFQRLSALDGNVTAELLDEQHRRAPNWMFSRYLRTLESIKINGSSRRDYVLLWTFALLDWQLGFAADVMFEYERNFGVDHTFALMQEETMRRLLALRPKVSVRSIARKLVPKPVRNAVRRALLG